MRRSPIEPSRSGAYSWKIWLIRPVPRVSVRNSF
ncbi:Uncharacterised protein [Bordetella pertussis]|nr:Uncharacterised protein [Bordetella pertussis]